MKNTLENSRSYMDVLFIYIVYIHYIKEFTELFGRQQKEAMIVGKTVKQVKFKHIHLPYV